MILFLYLLFKEVEESRRGDFKRNFTLGFEASGHGLRGEVNVLNGALGDRVGINDANDDWIDAKAWSEADGFHGGYSMGKGWEWQGLFDGREFRGVNIHVKASLEASNGADMTACAVVVFNKPTEAALDAVVVAALSEVGMLGGGASEFHGVLSFDGVIMTENGSGASFYFTFFSASCLAFMSRIRSSRVAPISRPV